MKNLLPLIFCILLFACPTDDDFEEETNTLNNANTDCSLEGYQSLGIDYQWESHCQAAYVYWCAGETDALEVQCDTYNSLASQLNLPDCPYCDGSTSNENSTPENGIYILYTTHGTNGPYGEVCNDIIVSIEGFGTKTISGNYLYEWGNPTCTNYVEHESLVKWELPPGNYTITTNCNNDTNTSILEIAENQCITHHYYKF